MVLSKQNFIWLAVLGLLIFIATSINLSWVQGFHNADSLLVTLISLDHYTPFYWSENRFGQPGPLVTSLIHDYSTNLFAQTELLVSASLGCVVLFNLYFLHAFISAMKRMAAAVFSMFICLCILAPVFSAAQMLAVGAQPYMPSLFLTLLALALIFRMPALPVGIRLAGALFCLLVAFWLNVSIASITVGLILVLDLNLRDIRWKQRLGGLLVLAAALGANVWLARQYSGPGMLVFQGRGHWFFGLRQLCTTVWPYFFHTGRLLAFVALLLAVLVAQITRRRISWTYRIPDVVAFLAAAIGYALVTAKTVWVAYMGYDPRYWTIPTMLLLLVATGWVSGALVRLRKAPGPDSFGLACASCLLVVAVVSMFGLPFYGKAKAYLAENLNRFDADERALGCTHFVGDYCTGWTSVFQRESSGGPPIYAIAHRSDVTRDRWDWAPGRPRTYCGKPGDPEREHVRRAFGLPPFRETVVSGLLCKLEIAPVVPVDNDVVIRELNSAVVSGSELELANAVDTLAASGDRQWIDAARTRLPSMQQAHLRTDVANQLARVGVFDGWGSVEATIMAGDIMLSFQAVNSVDPFRNMKQLAGQPFDLVEKLKALRASSSARDLREQLLTKITQLTH